MAQLVNKSLAAVAVSDELTTLLDWLYIGHLSSPFTLIVENAGGGADYDITDVQIDTSDDGGTTVALDQHAATPAVPIAIGTSSQAEFTTTAKYIRVRAVCAADEDTTAKITLLADSSTCRICTIAQVKQRLGLTGTATDSDIDATIAGIITGFEALAETFCERKLFRPDAAVTEYYAGCGEKLRLFYYPIISITSIKESLDYDFDNTDALTVNDDYRIANGGKNGIIQRLYSWWLDIEDSIQVVYKGAYTPVGETLGTGETALPADLTEAAIMQCSFIYKRRDDIGLTAVSYDGSSIQKFSAMDFLPLVKDILQKYRRISI